MKRYAYSYPNGVQEMELIGDRYYPINSRRLFSDIEENIVAKSEIEARLKYYIKIESEYLAELEFWNRQLIYYKEDAIKINEIIDKLEADFNTEAKELEFWNRQLIYCKEDVIKINEIIDKLEADFNTEAKEINFGLIIKEYPELCFLKNIGKELNDVLI